MQVLYRINNTFSIIILLKHTFTFKKNNYIWVVLYIKLYFNTTGTFNIIRSFNINK